MAQLHCLTQNMIQRSNSSNAYKK